MQKYLGRVTDYPWKIICQLLQTQSQKAVPSIFSARSLLEILNLASLDGAQEYKHLPKM